MKKILAYFSIFIAISSRDLCASNPTPFEATVERFLGPEASMKKHIAYGLYGFGSAGLGSLMSQQPAITALQEIRLPSWLTPSRIEYAGTLFGGVTPMLALKYLGYNPTIQDYTALLGQLAAVAYKNRYATPMQQQLPSAPPKAKPSDALTRTNQAIEGLLFKEEVYPFHSSVNINSYINSAIAQFNKEASNSEKAIYDRDNLYRHILENTKKIYEAEMPKTALRFLQERDQELIQLFDLKNFEDENSKFYNLQYDSFPIPLAYLSFGLFYSLVRGIEDTIRDIKKQAAELSSQASSSSSSAASQ